MLTVRERTTYDLSSLRQINIGGAAARRNWFARMEKAFHCEVLAGYGLTETSPGGLHRAPQRHGDLRR